MSNLIEIDQISRRSALRRIATAVAAAGATGMMNPLDAQHVHKAAADMKGALADWKRQELTEHEWKTLEAMANLILPADEKSGSAVDAGALEFVDVLCSEGERLRYIVHGGLSWFDAAMRHRNGKTFLEAGESEQKKLFDDLVAQERAQDEREVPASKGPYARFRDYQVWERSDLSAGVEAFQWIRNLVVDAYYSSPIGVEDLGYKGNGAFSSYEVPQESIDYAMSRSPFKA